MSYLVFCSFEVGGFPYKMAETLNRHGIRAYYISLDPNATGVNSTRFHYGSRRNDWDLSLLFNSNDSCFKNNIKALSDIKSRYGIERAFATGSKAFLLEQAGIDYIYWSYGSDLDQWCSFPIFPSGFPIWKKLILYPYFSLTFCNNQRRSIIKADSLMISSYQLERYRQIMPKKQLFFLTHLISVCDYDELCAKKAENKKKICETIKAEHFFFSSTRHFWYSKNKRLTDYKGNDVIFYSFKRYLEASGNKKSRLVLIERGPDLKKSKRLSEELGIDSYIVWLNEMKRDDIQGYYQGASMCFGQFGTAVLTYSALEPLSNATSCASFFGGGNNKIPFYKTMPPILNTKDPQVIANFMCKLTSDSNYQSELSYNSWYWAKENCSEEKFIEAFLKEMNI